MSWLLTLIVVTVNLTMAVTLSISMTTAANTVAIPVVCTRVTFTTKLHGHCHRHDCRVSVTDRGHLLEKEK